MVQSTNNDNTITSNETQETVIIPQDDIVNSTSIAKTQEEITLRSQARTIHILMQRIKQKIKKGMINEVYLISKIWFKKWTEYARYGFIKRSTKRPEIYKTRPLPFLVKKEKHPGPIDNSDILVAPSNYLNSKEEKIVVSEDKLVKKDYKLVSKQIWNILYSYYGGGPQICKGLKPEEGSTEYDIYHKKIQILFIPTREVIVNKEYIDKNVKMYTMYFPQYITTNEISNVLAKLLKEQEHEAIRLSLGITDEIEAKNLNFYFYKLKTSKTDQHITSLLIEKIDDIIQGKTIEADNYLEVMSSWITLRHLKFGEEGYNNILLCEYSSKNATMFVVKKEVSFSNYQIRTNNISEKPYKSLYGREFEKGGFQMFDMYTQNYMEEEEDISKASLSAEHNLGGLVGLHNLGNTCFMNTGLQCLSNVPELTEYFLKDYYLPHINKTNPIGSQGKLVEAYSQLVKKLWYGSKTAFPPHKFKNAIAKFQSMFSGFAQHDTHEFLGFLLDGLHEDLNKVLNKPYVQTPDEQQKDDSIEAQNSWNRFLMRNQSLLVDLFYGMYKSTVYCQNKECNNVSKAFDPFATLSLSITSSIRQYVVKCYFVFYDISIPILSFNTLINKDTSIGIFRKKIGMLLDINPGSFDILKNQGSEYVQINTDIQKTIDSFLRGNNNIYLVQIPPYVTGETDKDYISIYSKLQDTIKDKEKNFMEIDETSEIYGDKSIVEKLYITQQGAEIQNEWIKTVLYQFSYDEAIGAQKPEERISYPRIIYINKKWTNSQFYEIIIKYFSFILEKIEASQEQSSMVENKDIEISPIDDQKENQIDIEKLKATFFPDLEAKTKEFHKDSTLDKQKEINYPFVIIYGKIQKIYACKMTLADNWKNLAFRAEKESNLLSKIVDQKITKDDSPTNWELLFKIVWLPQYKSLVKEIFTANNEIEYYPTAKTFTESVELTDLIENFSKKEILTAENQWFCPKCKSEQLAEKKMDIYTCPDILIIHLKRFRNEQKLDSFVNFPLTGLDLTKHVKSIKKENENYIYDLIGVGNHYGSIHGGHYVAFAKNHLKNKWYEFNDDSVNEMDNENNVVTKSAYVLFYRRRMERSEKELEEMYKKPFIPISNEVPNK